MENVAAEGLGHRGCGIDLNPKSLLGTLRPHEVKTSRTILEF